MAADEKNSGPHTIGQVVAQLSAEFPDVTHSSLRFLEREGLISPARTAGGHRLFPDDQVERVRRIKTWQRQRLSLDDIRLRLDAADRLPDLSNLADSVLAHLIAGRRRDASKIILDADEAGVSLEALFDSVIRPVLEETGDRWERGELTVGQEKEISAFMRDVIAQLSPRNVQPGQPRGPIVVAACVEGEDHELGLAMISALLRRHGCTVYYLGASVSPAFLIERIQARRPDAVLLSVVQGRWLGNLEMTIAEIRAARALAFQPRIIVGGAGIPNGWASSDEDLTRIAGLHTLSDTVTKLEETIRDGVGSN